MSLQLYLLSQSFITFLMLYVLLLNKALYTYYVQSAACIIQKSYTVLFLVVSSSYILLLVYPE